MLYILELGDYSYLFLRIVLNLWAPVWLGNKDNYWNELKKKEKIKQNNKGNIKRKKKESVIHKERNLNNCYLLLDNLLLLLFLVELFFLIIMFSDTEMTVFQLNSYYFI